MEYSSVPAPGTTGDIRHGTGIAEATFADGIMTIGTDGATPMHAVAMLVVIMAAAILSLKADSMADRPSMGAKTTAAAFTAVVATAVDAGNQQNGLYKRMAGSQLPAVFL